MAPDAPKVKFELCFLLVVQQFNINLELCDDWKGMKYILEYLT